MWFGGGSGIFEITSNRYRVINVCLRLIFEEFYIKYTGALKLETNYQKNTMQYNMCKGPHFASSKKMKDLILFHEGFSSLRILWAPLCSNVDMKGYIWDNIWCLKFLCKCYTNSCYPTTVAKLCFLTHKILRLHSTCILHYNVVGVINFYCVFFLP